MSNAWGALKWGQGSWAAQGDVGQTVSGISASFSVGQVSIDAEVNAGWGRQPGTKVLGVSLEMY